MQVISFMSLVEYESLWVSRKKKFYQIAFTIQILITALS